MGDIGSGWYQDAFPPARKLAKLSFDWQGRDVTEIGCNIGEFGAHALASGARAYRGTDTNAECIAEALRRRPTLAVAHGHAPLVPLGTDVLVAFGVFHHMQDAAIAEVFAQTGARTVIFENPFAAVPNRNYYIRPLPWYLDLAAKHGYIHSRIAPYGFSYPVDRRFAIVSRDGWDVAARVDLRQHPEYWTAVGERVAALAAFVMADDPEPYVRWWCASSGRSRADAAWHVEYVRALIASLRDDGYHPARYQEGGRALDWKDGNGPISVTRRGATVTPRDGAHRACILRALGRPVPAVVWRG